MACVCERETGCVRERECERERENERKRERERRAFMRLLSLPFGR